MNISCPQMSISQLADLYCIFKNMDKRKEHKNVMILAQEAVKEIFRNSFFHTKNKYVQLKKGEPFNYVDIPADCLRFLSLSVEDKCHNRKPLYYNNNLNTLIKPKAKSCGCDKCDCGGLCDAIGGLTVTTKTVTIDGIDYTEQTWLKYCPNGDIMEYRIIPTVQYFFQRGSYDQSYDVSYDIGDTSSEVVNYILSRKLCKLDIKPCGCPAQTKENEDLFFNSCGCYLNSWNHSRKKCEKHWGDCNYFAGEIGMSECGTKIFVKHVEHFDENNQWLIMSYQTNGINPDEETLFPDYGKVAVFTGIEYYRSLFNDRKNPVQKQMDYYKFEDEKNKIITFTNPISIEWLESQNTDAIW